ncbi:glycoside hydrolase family 6 protein [Myceligenerans cantabricum]
MQREKKARAGIAVGATGALVAASALVALAAAPSATAAVGNPYEGAAQYVNPDWNEDVLEAADIAGGALGDDMRAIANEPTHVWMDRIQAIEGIDRQHGLEWHLDQAVEQAGGSPLVFNMVVYDLPGRDCFALASNGELPATDAGMERYKTEYIDAIVEILDRPEYENLRISAVIEPDSLPNLVTNMSHQPCQEAAPYYREGVQYALDSLHEVGNVYSYIDAAHSGWLGWPDNASGSAQEFASVVQGSTYGWDGVAGFVTNTANSTPLEEPFLTNPDLQVGSGQVRSADYYEWNPDFDEIDWTADLYDRMVAQGAPSRIGMLIDTSRNGWGGSERPTSASSSSNLNTYVDESRVDRRTHRGAWCNPDGAGIGERPTVSPSGYADSHLHAFVWVKPPGESDGSSEEIPNDEGKSLDRMCDPTYQADKLGGAYTGALPNAPLSGWWFQDQFEMLVANAYPAIGSGNNPDPDPTDDPTDEPTEDPTDEPTDDPTDEPVEGACEASLTVVNSWGGGFQGEVTVTGGADGTTGWTTTFDLPSGTTIGSLWNAEYSVSGSTVTASDTGWNGTLSAGQSTTFGFTANGTAPTSVPVSCS